MPIECQVPNGGARYLLPHNFLKYIYLRYIKRVMARGLGYCQLPMADLGDVMECLNGRQRSNTLSTQLKGQAARDVPGSNAEFRSFIWSFIGSC